MNPTVETLRQQLRQLQDLHDSGALGADALAQARAPLEQQLVAAVLVTPAEDAAASAAASAFATADAAEPPPPRPSRGLTLALVLGVLALAVAGYSLTGEPGLAGLSGTQPLQADAGASGAEPPVTEAQVNEIMDRMATRLREHPDDAQGWMLLARAYAALGRFSDAVPAYQQALALVGDDADLLADYADTLAAQASGSFTAEAESLVARALALAPDNIKALALSGSIAFDRRDYATAVRHWERVAAALPPDNPMRPQVLASVAQARDLGAVPPGPVPTPTPPPAALAAPVVPPVAAPSPPAGPGAGNGAALVVGAVQGRVTLAAALAGRADPEATVFILARPAAGPRMPLVVLRRQVKDLPLDFTLDDSMAMAPGTQLSQQAQVVVSARISASGDAMSQPGDLIGQSQPVAPGTRGLVIEISEVVAAPR